MTHCVISNSPKNIDICRRRSVKPILKVQITWRRFSSYIPSSNENSVSKKKVEYKLFLIIITMSILSNEVKYSAK